MKSKTTDMSDSNKKMITKPKAPHANKYTGLERFLISAVVIIAVVVSILFTLVGLGNLPTSVAADSGRVNELSINTIKPVKDGDPITLETGIALDGHSVTGVSMLQARALSTDGLEIGGAIYPSKIGSSTQLLSSDGTNAVWVTAPIQLQNGPVLQVNMGSSETNVSAGDLVYPTYDREGSAVVWTQDSNLNNQLETTRLVSGTPADLFTYLGPMVDISDQVHVFFSSKGQKMHVLNVPSTFDSATLQDAMTLPDDYNRPFHMVLADNGLIFSSSSNLSSKQLSLATMSVTSTGAITLNAPTLLVEYSDAFPSEASVAAHSPELGIACWQERETAEKTVYMRAFTVNDTKTTLSGNSDTTVIETNAGSANLAPTLYRLNGSSGFLTVQVERGIAVIAYSIDSETFEISLAVAVVLPFTVASPSETYSTACLISDTEAVVTVTSVKNATSIREIFLINILTELAVTAGPPTTIPGGTQANGHIVMTCLNMSSRLLVMRSVNAMESSSRLVGTDTVTFHSHLDGSFTFHTTHTTPGYVNLSKSVSSIDQQQRVVGMLTSDSGAIGVDLIDIGYSTMSKIGCVAIHDAAAGAPLQAQVFTRNTRRIKGYNDMKSSFFVPPPPDTGFFDFVMDPTHAYQTTM
jgi:hypothetical protein